MRMIVLFILISLGAEGQIIRGQMYYVPMPSAAQLLLDAYPNAAAAYSLRKLKSSYSGSAIRVRRSSDNTEQDIGFVGNDLDTASMKTFVGANDGFVTTWYSQGDSTSVNFTQTTAAAQPRIMTSGVVERRSGQPTIRFDISGTVDRMTVSASTAKYNYLHKAGQAAVFIVLQTGVGTTNPNAAYSILNNNRNGTSTIAGYGIYYDDRSGSSQNDNITSAVSRAVSASFVSVNTPQNFFTSDTLALLTNLLDNSTATAGNRNILYRNGANEQKLNVNTSAASTANATDNMALAISSNLVTTTTLNGYVSEIVLYPTDQTSNRTGIETNINNYYGLY